MLGLRWAVCAYVAAMPGVRRARIAPAMANHKRRRPRRRSGDLIRDRRACPAPRALVRRRAQLVAALLADEEA